VDQASRRGTARARLIAPLRTWLRTSHTRDRDGRARSRAHAGSYGGRRRHQLRTPVDVTTSIARKSAPPTTRRFDPGRHRLVRDRGGHRSTFGTLRLRAGKQARMGVGEEDRLPRVRSKRHDAVSGRVAKGRNETHAGHELRGSVLLQLHRVTTSRRAWITGQGARLSHAVPAVGLIFLTLLLPDRLGIHHPPPAWSPFPADIEIRSQAAGRSRPTYPLEFPRFQSDTRCARLALPVRPKDDGEEVLDLGFLDHSVDSAD
jgi:hypothetical protein